MPRSVSKGAGDEVDCDTIVKGTTNTSHGPSKPAIASQLDEIREVLAAIPAPLEDTPAVTAFCTLSTSSTHLSSCPAVLDWSALPAAVDADSTGMGVSTRKKAAYKPAKRPVDLEKVAARVARKRAQVESFLLVLQPLLEAAGHSIPCVVPAQQQQQQQQQQLKAQQSQCATNPHQQQHASSGCAQADHAGAFQHSPQQQQQQQLCAGSQTHLPQQQQQQELPPPPPPISLHVVDFGCGSGNLLLPLAALLPGCRFTGVDMKPAALQLLQKRAAAAGLANVSVFAGMIEQYKQPLDVGLALHACGNATDHVLQMCVDQGAAFVVSPCCVGKLRFSLTGGSSFHSSSIVWTPSQPGDMPVHMRAPHTPTSHPQQHHDQHLEVQLSKSNSNCAEQEQLAADAAGAAGAGGAPKLRHPRSDWLLSQLPDAERHFRIMAKVADMSHAPADRAELAEALQQRACVADACKRFVELDRCVAAAEAGYAVGLFKVLQADTMAKNDLLVGLPTAPAAAATAAAATLASATAAGVDEEQLQHNSTGVHEVVTALSRLGVNMDVSSCLCCCGQALCSSGVLFTRERLHAVRT